VAAGVLDEDLAHEPCGDAEEVGLILPAHLGLIHQPQVRLMNQSRGLHRVAKAFSTHIAVG